MEYKSDMLQYTNEYNNYMTRSTQNDFLYAPKARINVFKQSFQYTAPLIYNALPNVIKESTNLSCSKYQLKVYY